MVLHAMSADAERISGNLETRVEELALKHYALKGSRVLSKEELRALAAKIHKAEAACNPARVMQAAAEAGTMLSIQRECGRA